MIQQVFGFPVFIKNIDKNLYDREEIIKDIEYNYNKDKERNVWDKEDTNSSELHHCFNDWENGNFKKINFDKLIPVYINVFKEFFENLRLKKKESRLKFKIVNYTCMTSSQYMISHVHPECDFSAVHYIKFNEKLHASTLFENNNNYSTFSKSIRPNLDNILDNSCILNSWYYKDFSFKIKEDDICITPSFLSHSVPKQLRTDKTRITIVCNIEIE
jgi:hypothetical protein